MSLATCSIGMMIDKLYNPPNTLIINHAFSNAGKCQSDEEHTSRLGRRQAINSSMYFSDCQHCSDSSATKRRYLSPSTAVSSV